MCVHSLSLIEIYLLRTLSDIFKTVRLKWYIVLLDKVDMIRNWMKVFLEEAIPDARSHVTFHNMATKHLECYELVMGLPFLQWAGP